MLTPTSPHIRTYNRVCNRLGWALVIFLIIFLPFSLVSELLLTIVGEFVDPCIVAFMDGIVSTIAYMAPFMIAGILFYVIARYSHVETHRIRFEVKLPRISLLLIIAALGINTAAAYLNSWFCSWIGYTMPDELLVQQYDKPAVVIMYMTVALAPAFAEEFLFRGVVFGNLRPFGRVQAILISALTFSLMHQNIGQVFYTFVCGIMMAIMYDWTRSIWCSILFHMLNNELSIVTEVLYYGYFGDAIAPLLTLWDCILVALGVISAVILFVYWRREVSVKKAKQQSGVFDVTVDTNETFDSPVSHGTAARALRTPGMIVFIIFAILSMLSTMLVIYLSNAGFLE